MIFLARGWILLLDPMPPQFSLLPFEGIILRNSCYSLSTIVLFDPVAPFGLLFIFHDTRGRNGIQMTRCPSLWCLPSRAFRGVARRRPRVTRGSYFRSFVSRALLNAPRYAGIFDEHLSEISLLFSNVKNTGIELFVSNFSRCREFRERPFLGDARHSRMKNASGKNAREKANDREERREREADRASQRKRQRTENSVDELGSSVSSERRNGGRGERGRPRIRPKLQDNIAPVRRDICTIIKIRDSGSNRHGDITLVRANQLNERREHSPV